MNRLRPFLLVCLALTLIAGSTYAKENPARANQIRIINGYIECDGTKVAFALPEGGGLSIKERDGTAEYRLVSEKLDNNRASLALLDPTSGQALERFDVSLDGKIVRGTIVPLAFGLTGVTLKRIGKTEQPIEAAIAASEADFEHPYCCITCGNWQICCESPPGWCCTVECLDGSQFCQSCHWE